MIIELLDKRRVDSSQLSIDWETYHVFLDNKEDVTRNVRQNDKVAIFPGFDRETDNLRAYNEKNGGTGPVEGLDESTVSIFVDQMLNDPLAAPLEALDNTTEKILTSKTGKVVVVIVGIGLLVWAVNKFTK
jgi:hypothetical protein